MNKESLLLVSNYTNKTGYAWNNIYNLFTSISKSFLNSHYNVFISFNNIIEPVSLFTKNSFSAYFMLPPYPSSIKELSLWRHLIHSKHIKYIYFTDHASSDFNYFVFKLFGVKKIIVHNRISVENPYLEIKKFTLKDAFKFLKNRLPFLGADRIYAVSNFVKDRLILKEKVKPNKIITIYNGINLDRFYNNFDKVDNTSQKNIFICGRATYYKGIHILIHALQSITKFHNINNITVNYAGNGPHLNDFITLSHKLGVNSYFNFLGEISDITEFLKSADIVVVPSIWGDAFPSSVSEALAAGKPLIATRAGGIPEIVGDEKNAVLIEPNNIKALELALLELLNNSIKRKLLSKNARKRAILALDEKKYHKNVIYQLFNDFKINK